MSAKLTTAIVAALTLTSMTCLPAKGDSAFPNEGQVYQTISADLNNDGAKETITLTAYNVSDEEYYGQIKVLDYSGRTIWTGPRPTKPGDPLAFGSFMWGEAKLCVVMDTNNDGQVSLIGTTPQSDVRPSVFRMFDWNGSALTPKSKRCLIEEPALSGRYAWTAAPEEYGKVRWVGSLYTASDGTTRARIFDTHSTSVKVGEAVVAPSGNGLGVVRWVSQPK